MAESNVAAAPKETQQSAKPTRKGSLLSRVAYSFGNVGQSAFYNALSTYFIVYVTSSLFSGVDKALATKLIGVITGLVVVIRIAEIFIDPLLGNIIDNTKTKWGRFKPWQLIGGTVSAVLLVLVYTGLFGLVKMFVEPPRCQQIEVGHSLVLLQIIPVHHSVPAKLNFWLCR